MFFVGEGKNMVNMINFNEGYYSQFGGDKLKIENQQLGKMVFLWMFGYFCFVGIIKFFRKVIK